MAIRIQQNVLRLQIPVDDPDRVKVTESQGQLGQVELDIVLGEHDLLGQSGEQVPTAEKVQDQVELAFSLNKVGQVKINIGPLLSSYLESVLEFDNEGMVDIC